MTVKHFLLIVLAGFLVSCSNENNPDKSRFLEYAVNYFNQDLKKGETSDIKNIRIDTVLFMSSQKAELLRANRYQLYITGHRNINHYAREYQFDSLERWEKRAKKLPKDDIIGYRVKYFYDFINPDGKLEPGVWLKTFDLDYKPLDEFDWAILENEFFLIDKPE